MADNKKKVGRQDDNLIAFKERYEFDYALAQLQKQFPKKDKQKVKSALVKAAKKISPSEGRKKIMAQAKKNLRSH